MKQLNAQQWEDLHHEYIAHGQLIGKEHLVVSAAIVCNSKLLLVRRAADDSYAGNWEYPGGGVDPDEKLVDAIRREVFEETGIKLPQHPKAEVLTHTTATALRVVVKYELDLLPTVKLSDEHDDFIFFGLEQLKSPTAKESAVLETLRPENKAVMKLLLERSLGLEM